MYYPKSDQNAFIHVYNTSVCVDNLQFVDKMMDLTGVNR